MSDEIEPAAGNGAGERAAGPRAAIASDEAATPDDAAATDSNAVAVDTSAVDAPTSGDQGDTSLLALIDRLGQLLERSELTELGVEAGGTSLVLRKPVALPAPVPAAAAALATSGPGVPAATAGAGESRSAVAARPSVKAPLTGVWYGSPAPGSAPFVEAGREVAVGQVVGMIEAMKLFNEIKSDLAGRVVRVIPESGALVKAKQPLIEVDPL